MRPNFVHRPLRLAGRTDGFGKIKKRAGGVSFCVLFGFFAVAPLAAADEIYELDIAAQTVTNAIKTLSYETQHSVLFQTNDISDVKTSRLQGRYSLEDAVKALLKDTNLNGGLTESGVIVITLSSTGNTPDTGENTVDTTTLKKTLLTGAAIASATTFTSAQAQTAETAEPPVLDEVITTATRRESNVQDTPVAISAFSAEALKRRQISSTQDLDRVTPSLQFATSGQLSGNNSAAVVFIRGVGQIDPTPAVDPGVGIYVDEVYLGRAVGGAIDFADIKSVEVLRGPQGTLFGRNTIGGAILVRTNEPGDEFGGTARLRTGSDNLFEGFAALNLPIAETFKGRVSGGFRKRDGYVTRVFDGQDLGNDNTFTLNGSARWEPADKFELLLRADYTEESENGSPFVFAGINETAPVPALVSVAAGCPGATSPFTGAFGAGGPPFVPDTADARCANDAQALGPFSNGGTAPVESTLKGWGISATANYYLSDQFTLKSITALRGVDWTGIRDADNTSFDILTTSLDSSSEQFSQEFQVQYDADKLSGLVGFYYFDEKTEDRTTIPLAFPPSPPVVASLMNGGPGSRDLQLINLENESFAIFSDLSYDLTDKLSISGGLRYTEDKKGFQGTILNLFPATVDDPSPLPTLATTEGGPLFIFNRKFEDKYTALTGSASVQYKWTDEISSYLSYGTSFKSGGFNTRYNAPTADNLPISFDEEFVETIELGLKADLASNVRFNTALFTSNYDDLQLIFRQGVVPLIFNAGSASIDGVEAELTYLPTSDLIFEAGFSYLDARYDSITPIPGATATITTDEKLPLTPEFQGNIGVSYAFHPSQDLSLTPRIDLSYTASQFFDVGNTEIVAQNEGVYFVSGSVKLENEANNWSIVAGVENLTDELFLEQGNASFATLGYAEAIYARPRTWFVEISKDF